MGCCVSTNKPSPSSQFHRSSSKSSRNPPPVDVETVKEVLSETPNHKHFSQIEDEPRKTTPRNSLHKNQHQQNNNLEDHNVSEEVSEISEIVSTTTFEEDFEILRLRVTDRSPEKLRNRKPVSGELRVVGKSPARGKQQSPVRVRSVSERGSGYGYGSAGRQMPVPGTGPASRSRSPANRTVAGGGRNGIGRSPSARKAERSPARVSSGLPERVRKPEMSLDREREEFEWPPANQNDDESLENPLVSLECFIFL